MYELKLYQINQYIQHIKLTNNIISKFSFNAN